MADGASRTREERTDRSSYLDGNEAGMVRPAVGDVTWTCLIKKYKEAGLAGPPLSSVWQI